MQRYIDDARIAFPSRTLPMIILISVAIVLLSSSCANKPMAERTTDVAIYADQAFFTFLEGDVSLIRRGAVNPATLDDFLKASDCISTGAGSACEIQYGESALVRVEENTVLVLGKVSVAPGSSTIDIRIESGAIVCKVKKLLGEEYFNVRTNPAVFAVRGTTFAITVDNSGGAKLAVGEGAVAVLPGALAGIERSMALPQAFALRKTIESVFRTHARLVPGMNEIIVTEKAAIGAERAFSQARKMIGDLSRGTTVTESDAAALASLVERKTIEAVAMIGEPVAISETAKRFVNGADAIRRVGVTILAPEDKASGERSGGGGEASVPESDRDAVGLVRIASEPSEATVLFDGEVIGTSPAQVASVGYGIHTVVLSKQGYATVEGSVEVRRSEHAFSFRLDAETLEAVSPRDILDVVGPARRHAPDGSVMDDDDPRTTYALTYRDRYAFEIVDGRVSRLVFSGPPDFLYASEVSVGSTRRDVERLLGKPDEIVDGWKIYIYEQAGIEIAFLYDRVDTFSISRLDSFPDLVPAIVADQAEEDAIWDFYHRINRLRERYGVD